MRADMLWQLSIESGACEYMEFTHEDEKLIRLACAYVVLVIQIWLAHYFIIDYGGFTYKRARGNTCMAR